MKISPVLIVMNSEPYYYFMKQSLNRNTKQTAYDKETKNAKYNLPTIYFSISNCLHPSDIICIIIFYINIKLYNYILYYYIIIIHINIAKYRLYLCASYYMWQGKGHCLLIQHEMVPDTTT